jgi:E3 ubiquitin-protein ligase HECTD1
LEFYALVSAELQRRDLGLWLCDDVLMDQTVDNNPPISARSSSLDSPHAPPGYYVHHPKGLFPAPLPQDSEVCDRAAYLF